MGQREVWEAGEGVNEEQYAEVKAKLASNDTEHGSFRRRLDEHDEKIEKLQQTQILLERLTNAVNNLSTGVGELKTTVQRVDSRVAALEQEPADKWKKITWEIVKWAVIGVLAFAAGVAFTNLKGA